MYFFILPKRNPEAFGVLKLLYLSDDEGRFVKLKGSKDGFPQFSNRIVQKVEL